MYSEGVVSAVADVLPCLRRGCISVILTMIIAIPTTTTTNNNNDNDNDKITDDNVL